MKIPRSIAKKVRSDSARKAAKARWKRVTAAERSRIMRQIRRGNIKADNGLEGGALSP